MANVVSIGCKLPNGLILQMGDRKVVLAGANSSRIVGGFGITENVDAEFWSAWRKRNEKLAFVKAGLVFAQPETASVQAAAVERATERSGLEPLDPNKDLPKGVEASDDHKAKQ